MTSPNSLPEQLVYLIIRFTADIPDLPLTITSPRTITTLSLKQLIRDQLPPSHAAARLRLIYAGKVLADTTPLSASLRLPPPSPLKHGTHNDYGPGSKSKGKQPVRDPTGSESNGSQPKDERKYYVHCSMGDTLSLEDLEAEALAAQRTEEHLQKQYEPAQPLHRRNSSGVSGESASARRRGSSSATAGPQGFDRLLASGFSAQEVATLRLQFQNNIAYTHTPDTMPSAAELRAMEDRWLDSTATDPSASLGGTTEAEAGWGAGFAVEEGGLDDMLYGYITGFFWPLGAFVWGFREEGVWSRRRQLAVVMGVALNLFFGFVRWGS